MRKTESSGSVGRKTARLLDIILKLLTVLILGSMLAMVAAHVVRMRASALRKAATATIESQVKVPAQAPTPRKRNKK